MDLIRPQAPLLSSSIALSPTLDTGRGEMGITPAERREAFT